MAGQGGKSPPCPPLRTPMDAMNKQFNLFQVLLVSEDSEEEVEFEFIGKSEEVGNFTRHKRWKLPKRWTVYFFFHKTV
jgi:hypothetical protein